MRKGGATPCPGGRLRGAAGFSLIELVIAVVAAIIVGFGVFAIFSSQRRANEAQRVVNDLRTSCTFAMDQITRELQLAGYRATNPAGPVSDAGAGNIDFEYWDDHAPDDWPFDTGTYDRHTEVSFRLDPGGELVRKFKRWNTTSASYQPATAFADLDAPYKQTLAKNVLGFALSYFKGDNVAWVGGADPLSAIRSVVVSLDCRSAKPNPVFTDPSRGVVSSRYPRLHLQAEVRLRNADIASNPRDTVPPPTPTNLRAWDPGRCGTLGLSWDASTASDLAGYLVSYGLATDSYSNQVRIGRGPGAAGSRVSHALAGLQTSPAGAASPTTYYFRIEAFDRSGNPSPRSPEISGNPNPSVRVDTVGKLDTTITIDKPAPPAGFSAALGAAEGEVDLSWGATADPDILGWRLFRSTDPAFTPSGTAAGEGNCIADESTLTATGQTPVTAFADRNLVSCTTYTYKLAAIVACDPTLAATYVGADYATAFGDGPGGMTDSPRDGVTNTTPADYTPDSPPTIVARPGYKRSFLSLANPDRSVEADFDHTEVLFSRSGFPGVTPRTVDSPCQVSGGTLVPDHGQNDPRGVFSAPGSVGNAFVHDSEILASPTTPELANDATYYYLAVAYDTCGNCSPATSRSTTLAALCGDDPPGLPAGGDSIGLHADGCGGSLQLSWDEGTLKDVPDFAGYHLYRANAPAFDPAAAVELTGGVPQWPNASLDATVAPGELYSYAVRYTDCAYEHRNDPGATSGGNISPPHAIHGLSVGEVAVDSGHRVLSGDLVATPLSFEHNLVAFSIRNTSGGPLTITGLTPTWPNPSALLRRIVVGDGATTARETVWEDTSPTLTKTSGSTIPLLKSIDARDDKVPVVLEFALADGTVDARCDMREESVSLETLFRNDTTGTVNCARSERLDVPLGPYVSGTTQSWPTTGTMAWPVPGGGGNNPMNAVLVPGNQMVDVFTNVSVAGFAGTRTVRLYYYVDAAKTLSAAPALDPANLSIDNLSPYQRIDMVPVAGDQWRTPVTPTRQGIPASNDANVWYFIVAVDNDGNFDREPEQGSGAFQYYQQPFDVCRNIPQAPVLSGSASSTTVVLSWPAVAQNTDGTSFTDAGGYNVYRAAAGAGPQKLATVGPATHSSSDLPPNMGTVTYSYFVTAFDTCYPANESVASTWYTECQGAPPCSVNLLPTRSPLWSGNPGDSFAVSLAVCSRQNGAPGEVLYAQACSGVDANPLRLVEDGDSGTFRIDAGAYGGEAVRTWLTLPGSPTDLDLRVASSDTVSLGGFAAAPGSAWGTTCGTGFSCIASLQVVADPCVSPARPSAPRNLTITVDSKECKGGDHGPVDLAWQAPTTGPVSGYRIYRCMGAGCTPAQIGTSQSTGYTDQDAGASLKANVFTYAVTAINDACAANVQESTRVSATETCQ